MNKKTLLIVLIVLFLCLIGGGYYYWKINIKKTAAEKAVDDLQKTSQSTNDVATKGTIPSIDPTINPMTNTPNTNPFNNTNPFSDVKINPFK